MIVLDEYRKCGPSYSMEGKEKFLYVQSLEVANSVLHLCFRENNVGLSQCHYPLKTGQVLTFIAFYFADNFWSLLTNW